MDYKIVLMRDAEEDLDRFIAYLLFEKKSEQAARNLLNDFEATKTSLSNVAGSLKLCDNPKLKELGYRRINFLSHRYFMIYRIDNDTVYVDNIFHEFLEFQKDGQGVKCDVRDIVVKRKDIEWEVGLSIKHNHDAVKHSRLSHKLDFGKEWFEMPCSDEY